MSRRYRHWCNTSRSLLGSLMPSLASREASYSRFAWKSIDTPLQAIFASLHDIAVFSVVLSHTSACVSCDLLSVNLIYLVQLAVCGLQECATENDVKEFWPDTSSLIETRQATAHRSPIRACNLPPLPEQVGCRKVFSSYMHIECLPYECMKSGNILLSGCCRRERTKQIRVLRIR